MGAGASTSQSRMKPSGSGFPFCAEAGMTRETRSVARVVKRMFMRVGEKWIFRNGDGAFVLKRQLRLLAMQPRSIDSSPDANRSDPGSKVGQLAHAQNGGDLAE